MTGQRSPDDGRTVLVCNSPTVTVGGWVLRVLRQWRRLPGMADEDVNDCSMQLPDGRALGWTDIGPGDGTAVLRFPGTPGSRWVIRADRSPWRDRRLRMITGERPGFGRSSPLPGRGFAAPADDQAHLLDHLDLHRVHVYGASGAAPHILAFAGRHPDRVHAVTIVSGAAPITDAEAE